MKVDQLSESVHKILNKSYPDVTVYGSVGSVTISSGGNIYFDLIGEDSSIRCVCYRKIARNCLGYLQKGKSFAATGSLRYNGKHCKVELVVQRVSLSDINRKCECDYCDSTGIVPIGLKIEVEEPCPMCDTDEPVIPTA